MEGMPLGLVQGLERFQKMCSRRRQSAQIELKQMIWRELTFAAAELIELPQGLD